jgi:hypothetical protein
LVLGSRFKFQGFRIQVSGLGLRFRVQGFEFKVYGLRV